MQLWNNFQQPFLKTPSTAFEFVICISNDVVQLKEIILFAKCCMLNFLGVMKYYFFIVNKQFVCLTIMKSCNHSSKYGQILSIGRTFKQVTSNIGLWLERKVAIITYLL